MVLSSLNKYKAPSFMLNRASSVALGITTDLNNDNSGSFQANGLMASPEYATAVAGGWWGLPNDDGSIPGVTTLTGLTVGNDYEDQLWSNDSRNGRGTNFVMRLDGTTDMFLSLATDGTGGVGQYNIGTFTATAATQEFTAQGFLNDAESHGRTQINMIQLRDVTEGSEFEVGDVNCDGSINFLDITPFIAVLSSGGFEDKADIDRNGTVNFLDISPFIALLSQ